MRTKFFLWAIFSVLVLLGCEDEMPDYYDSRSYDLEDFDAVALGDALQVEIIQGTVFSVIAKGETSDIEDLDLRVENGVLTGQYSNPSKNHKRTRVIIYMPELTGVKMKAATDTRITGFHLPGVSFLLELSGASAALVEANFKFLEVRIQGASELVVKGEGEQLSARVDGASRLNGRELDLHSVDIEVSGASEAVIKVKDRLEGSVQGSSHLRYHGNPQMLDVYVSSESQMTRW